MLAVTIGVLSALAVLIVMMRLGIRKFMGYPAICDALVVYLLIVMLHGSYVGMVAAVIGGLAFSGAITVIRKFYGYAKLTSKGWVYYDGLWTVNLKAKMEQSALSVSKLKEIKKDYEFYQART